jgi:Leucine-rich repeat (LRR) protein
MSKESGSKRRLLRIFVACFFVVTASVLLVIAYETNSSRTQTYKESEKIIDGLIAKQLNKDPNELTNEDFVKLETLTISGPYIVNLNPLAKLKNLRSLCFTELQSGRNQKTPQWLVKLKSVLGLQPPIDYKYIPVNISNLKNNKNLEKLSFVMMSVSNFRDIAKLTNLRDIELVEVNITDDNVSEYAYINLKPLRKLRKLQRFHIGAMTVDNIRALSGLTNLNELGLSMTTIKDKSIEPLHNLKNLEKLHFDCTQIDSIEPIKDLKKLEVLAITQTGISDITPLKNLTNLKNIALSGKEINDISILSNFKILEGIYLGYSENITDLRPLEQLSKLQTLNLDHAKRVADIELLAKLNNLQELYLSFTQVSDISPLAKLLNLQQLALNNTKINDINALQDLTNLQYLDLSDLPIKDISSLSKMTKLKRIRLSRTQVNNIEPLLKLVNLEKIDLDRTKIIDIDLLRNLPKLDYLLISSEQISEEQVKELKKDLPKLEIVR